MVGTTNENRPPERPRLRWKDHIKTGFEQIGLENVEWVHFAQGRDQC
jgi:hypothetical protein